MTDNMPRGRSTEVDDAKLIEVAKKIEEPCFGNGEVAEYVSIGPERVRERLNALEDKGVLNKKKVGSANVYWLASF